MKTLITIICLALLPSMLVAQKWQQNSASVTFKIKNAGLNVDGKFTETTTDITFDPGHPEEAVMNATIKTRSIDTGIKARDKHLRSEDYFNSEVYPDITFKSKSVKKISGNQYQVTGDLTILKTTREATIVFTVVTPGNAALFSGTLTVKRSDYKLGGAGVTMGDEVTVSIVVQSTK